MDDDEVVIHSWRDVFQTRWVTYRIMGVGVPWAGGLSFVPAGYFFLGVALVWIGGHLFPPVAWVPFVFRYSIPPFLLAVSATRKRKDGRTPRAYLFDKARLAWRRFGRRRARPRNPLVPVRFDGTGTVIQPGRVTGPHRITFNRPVKLTDRQHRVVVRPDPEGQRASVVLCSGMSLEVQA